MVLGVYEKLYLPLRCLTDIDDPEDEDELEAVEEAIEKEHQDYLL